MFDAMVSLEPEQALCMPRPNANPDCSGERVCEFGTELMGREIYVKVTVVGVEDGAAGCVISFHFPERPMTFPFK